MGDSAFAPHGRHLIAGEWVEASDKFHSSPASGPAQAFSAGSAEHVDAACRGAEAAFAEFSQGGREDRAAFLEAIAEEIEARGAQITQTGMAETGLPEARLEGERGRTTGQIRLFAELIRKGEHLDARHDSALPDRAPLPRPDLRAVQRPVGPVAVFGASNFPLAFSTAGGDTASALAAGCPVVVKGHEAHPATTELVAEAIHAAIGRSDVPAGVVSIVHGGSHEVGAALVRHPLICAVGFTGSLKAGRALFDMCAQREVPIPFFGELGSVNPMFLLPAALAARGAEIAAGWAGSLTMGAGQFCTNPGVAVAIAGEAADGFAAAAAEALGGIAPQTMLTEGIAAAYREGRDRLAGAGGVQESFRAEGGEREAAPCLLETTGEQWLANRALGEEVFGPLGLLVRVGAADEMRAVAESLEGQLTCTLHLDDSDADLARSLMPTLERKAGRILANGFPTGVEVCGAMVHGGPYPASTNFGATSVGTLAIRRFLRPVCYQNVPEALLPADLA